MKIVTLIKIIKKIVLDKDEWSKFFLAEKLFNLIYPKMKIQEFDNIMFDDKNFTKYYEKMVGDNYHSFDRKYNLKNLMNLVENVEGEIAECGVFRGATAYLIAEKFSSSTIYLFDTFCGLSQPNESADGEYWKKGDLSADLKLVQTNLSKFLNLEYKQGFIPEKFHEVSNSTFKFVHIDVDLYEPTKDSLEFFYSRMTKGGMIICDDYGFSSCPGAKKAFDDFLADKQESIVQLSSGQAFIIKE